MSNSPHPNPAPDEEHSTHRSSSILLGVAAGLGVIAAAGAIVAVVWGDRLIETQVLPRVEAQLAETIGRPIDLGQVEGIFIWGVRLENIVIPPHGHRRKHRHGRNRRVGFCPATAPISANH